MKIANYCLDLEYFYKKNRYINGIFTFNSILIILIEWKFQLQLAQNRDNARLTLDLHNVEVLYAQVENSIGNMDAQKHFEQIQAEYEKVIAFEEIKRELYQIDKDDVNLKHIYTNCNDPLINTLSVWGRTFKALE